MNCTNYRILVLALASISAGFAGCGEDGLPSVPGPGDDPVTRALAESCGINVECDANAIVEGDVAVSGVASIDAFFGAVASFDAKAGNVSAGIEAELAAIRADFGIAADADFEAAISTQITANVEGSLSIEAEPARCSADVSATLDAQARCEGMVEPGSVMVACEGSCEVEASADVSCSAEADLKCTVTAPSVECEGTCQGSCEATLEVAASCSGTCRGSCDGECSAYANGEGGMAECAGTCDGMCEGSCETEVAGEATCEGTCKGECTVTNPEAGCEGGIRAECEGKANAMVMCEGRCEGEVTPPMASVECDASVKAEAKMNVECTPPRVAINYKLKAVAGAELEAQARFVAAVENLKVRLPALLASIKRAELVAEAGAGLSGSAVAAIDAGKTAAADLVASGNLRVAFGLACAVQTAAAVPGIITESTGELTGQINASASVLAGLGM